MLWILLVLALVAAAVIGTVLFRHWKEIRLLDPGTIKAEQERKVRERIVKQRFDRRLRHMLAPVQRAGRNAVSRLANNIRQAEERLAHAAGMAGRLPEAPEAIGDIQALLQEAGDDMAAARWPEAERVYLELLKRDKRNLHAYRGLGALYLAQRQHAQAREIFLFLERIHGCDDACYAGLAAAAEAEGNAAEAEMRRKQAVEAAPKNADRHAELAAFYLSHGSPEYAAVSARHAADLSPTDPRALEVCIEAAILLRDRAEAERRYEQLRPVTDDPGRLQTLNAKINALGG